MKHARIFRTSLFAIGAGLGSLLLVSRPVLAASFDGNRIIDDQVFSNASTMSAGSIDAFLNSLPNSCISPNSGFSAVVPTGYSPSGGYTYGGYGSAGQVIATASQVYGINPQVLLATLQKEQSLVAGAGANYCTDGDEHKYAAAAGYGCPDGGTRYSYSGVNLYRRNGVVHSTVNPTCVNTAAKAGFSQQVIRAAWLLKFGQQRSLGNVNWAVITGSWDNSDDPESCYGGPVTAGYRQVCPSGPSIFYDGFKTIDNTAVQMSTGATAALYWYTPHFSGNQNFFNIFVNWFGLPYANDTEVAHPNGTLVYDHNGIYLIQNDKRSFFKYPQVIDSYHYNWDKIKLLSTGDWNLPEGPVIDTLAPGTIFRTDNSPTYIMDYDTDGVLKKRTLSNYTLAQLGYTGRDVMYVPPYVVPPATFGSSPDVAQHPSGTLVVFYGIPAVYLIDHGTLRTIQNELAFDSNDYKMSNIKGGTQLDSWLPAGQPVLPRGGTMVLTAQGIVLIDYDTNGIMSRPVGPWECYSNRLHYSWDDWISGYEALQVPPRVGPTFSC